jgi:hypothetical protein
MTAGFGVWASLNATAFNTSPESVSSGTLSLTLVDNGDGFTTNVTNMAPGDVVDRYVNLTNGGNLAAKALTMSVAATGSSTLITDGTTPPTKALTVAVNTCSGGTWAAATGVCSGTSSSLLGATTLSSLASAQSLIAGAIAVNEVEHLQIVMTLPDQTETTTNGSAPATTIQGKSASLTYTFTESQRTATTTDS